MKTCGLTGGLGMGKSTAAEILRARDVAVVDTDELARELVRPGEPALAEIKINSAKISLRPTANCVAPNLPKLYSPMPPPAKNWRKFFTRASATIGSYKSKSGAGKITSWLS